MNRDAKWISWFFDLLEKVSDWLNEQQWYQELLEKWQSLDNHSKNLVKLGSGALGAIVVSWVIVQSIWSVYDTKGELEKKLELLNMIQSANNELSVIKGGKSSTSTPGQKVNWETYFSEKASRAGIDATRMQIQAGTSKSADQEELANESSFQINMKQVNIKQLVRFSFFLESGAEPVKVRTLAIDTEGFEGYLNATVLVSSFEVKDEEG